jgi:serpin B
MPPHRSRTRQSPPGIALALALSLALAGCGPTVTATPPAADVTPSPEVTPMPDSTPTPGVAPENEARSARPRELAPSVSEYALADLAAGNRAFAWDLYQAVRTQDGNLFFSPYSVSLALAMTFAGARGDTEAEMAQTLHFTLPQEQLHPAFNALDLSLTADAGADSGFQLNLANAIWGQQGFDFLPAYLDRLAVNYGAGLQLADFTDPAQREQARAMINTWVSAETQGKIKELFVEGTLTEATRLVLANAIYFRADWETPFPAESTDPAPFTLLDGSQVQVPTMSRRASTGYTAADGVEAVELYYKGDRASLVILLPAAGQFEAFEAGLEAGQVEDLLQRLQPTDLQLYLPKFEYAASLDLAGTLAGMGMPAALSPGGADFSGMTGERDLHITGVVHKAFVAVDEKGTEAAAATGVTVGVTSMPQEVRVDRPFLYVIRDRETGTLLFVGRVLDPGE